MCIIPLAALGADNAYQSGSQAKVTIRIDSVIPAVTLNKIKSISSLFGEAAIGQPLPIPPMSDGQQTMIMATTKEDDILLGAMVTGKEAVVTLSAASTAVLMVRMAQGVTPPGISALEFSAAIEASSEFKHLTDLVSAALKKGVPPMDHEGVAESVLMTLSQASASIHSKNMDMCEKRMFDYAVEKRTDPNAYISQNKAYLAQCRQAQTNINRK